MYLLADIGGTKTRIAGTRDMNSFSDPIIFDTPSAYEDGIGKIVETAHAIAGNESITAMVMGVPGVISHDHDSLVVASNLKAWVGKPLGNDLARALNARVYVENDAAQVGLGEAVYGGGKGASVVVYITVSTGVGGTRIVNGVIDSADTSAEMGHQYVHVGDTLQAWDEIISGKAIQEKYHMHPRDLGKNNPLWEELARETAIGIHNAILFWTPDRIVLGGSMFNEIGISVERVAYHLKAMMKAFPTVPEVVHSQLDDVGGLWGGLVRLRQLN